MLWLNQRDLDIRCIRVRPHADGGRVLLDVQQILPLPEVEEYQVRLREKAVSERASRASQDSRSERYKRFWTQLLATANGMTEIHAGISPASGNWIAATNHGIGLNYVLSRGRARVEIYIGRPDGEENSAILEDLHSSREAIEQAFNSELDWQWLDGKTACRIAAPVDGPLFEDEAAWGELQGRMVQKMIDLEAAFRPYLAKYRAGEKPPTTQPEG